MRRLAGALAAILVVTLAACAAPPQDDESRFLAEARPLTTTEAQTLAAMRLRNDALGTRTASFTVRDGGTDVAFDGWYDYASATGYGLARTGSATQLLLWNHGIVATRPAEGDVPPLPVPAVDAPGSLWQARRLDAATSRLDGVLALLSSLGADRPDNPLLLQQSGALWLGERTPGAVPLAVFAGPPSDQALPSGATADPAAAVVRYWVDPATATLVRVDVRLGGGGSWTTAVLGDAGAVSLGAPLGTAAAG